MDKSEAIGRLEYLKARAQIALEQEVPDWIAEDVLGTIEAYDMAIEALQTKPTSSENPNNCETCGTPRHLCEYCIEEDRMWTPKTEPTDCETCKHYHPDHEAIACERCLDGKYSRYEPKTEPQAEREGE